MAEQDLPWYGIKNADQVPSPAVLIYPDRVRENLRRMIDLVGDVNRLRPHVKTHKLSEIVKIKLEMGIAKFKAATIAEAEMTAAAGGKDVLLAYQPVGPSVGRFLDLIQAFPETTFSTIVDNEWSLNEISAACQSAGVTANLYIDLNVGMDRTGIPVGQHAASLYRLISGTAGVHASGFHAYDGHIHESDEAALVATAESTFDPVWKLREQLIGEGFPVPHLVLAGTPTSRLLASYDDVEVGAGTIVFWDAGQPQLSPDLDFLNAAVLLARVVSRPTPNRLCLDLGHKAVASEMPSPRVVLFGLEDAIALVHSEEHLVLETQRADAYPVGTVVYGLPWHICPTVALHKEVCCVEQHKVVDRWSVVARDRRITW